MVADSVFFYVSAGCQSTMAAASVSLSSCLLSCSFSDCSIVFFYFLQKVCFLTLLVSDIRTSSKKDYLFVAETSGAARAWVSTLQ